MSRKTTKKRGKNEKSLKNLQNGKKFSSENQPAKNGRKKKLENIIKDIPEDAQIKIYETLFATIKQPNRSEALRFLKERENELGEYGFVFQIALEELAGKNGMATLEIILDRIFGRPKQQTDLNLSGEIKGIEITFKDYKAKADGKEGKKEDS